jgi:PAS domain-containing protein
MMRSSAYHAGFAALRRRAEEKLQSSQQKLPEYSASQEEIHRIIHELDVRQIELELQQDELLKCREDLEKGIQRYSGHYDFSPHSYLSLSPNGTVVDVNLTAAKLLGRDRKMLKGDRFERFLSERDVPVFKELVDQVFTHEGRHFCDVMLLSDEPSQTSTLFSEGGSFYRNVHIDAVLSSNGEECLVFVTERKMKQKETRVVDDFSHLLLDKVIHSRIRFAALSYLYVVNQAFFVEIRNCIKATDGNLSIHMRMLESAQYISCDKEFQLRKPQTIYRITPQGRDAFIRYSKIVSALIAEHQPDE